MCNKDIYTSRSLQQMLACKHSQHHYTCDARLILQAQVVLLKVLQHPMCAVLCML
jgi:hypothetical protein